MHTDLIVTVPSWVLLAYLISGVCFILALRGLSSPESSRRGNYTGMVGMAIAVITTLIVHFTGTGSPASPGLSQPSIFMVDTSALIDILAAIMIGGTIGLVIARRIP